MANGPFHYITIQEAMSLLGVSRATIDRWRKDKQLPSIKIGKEVLFDEEQIKQWLMKYKHEQELLRHAMQGSQTQRDSTTTIAIGYQTGAAQLWSPLIMRHFSFFEEELASSFPQKNFHISWVNAPNGMELVEELIAGRIHIASVGDYPISASWCLDQVLPSFKPVFLAFDGKTAGNNGIALVLPTGSKIKYPDQLSSERLSAVSGSSSAYRLERWKHQHELQAETIIHRNMAQCLQDIMERKTGASILWEPYLSWMQHIGAGRRIGEEVFSSDYLTGLITNQHWADDNEDIIICYLKAHLRAHQYIRMHREKAAMLIHRSSGYPAEVVYEALSRIHWDASIYQRDVEALLNLKHNLSPLSSALYQQKPSSVNIQPHYLQQAIEQLRLPLLPDKPIVGDWSLERLY